MPKQNRVTPFGELVAVPEYGTRMGNRGVLHDPAGTIRRAWQLRRWILCVLEFNGRQRTVMAPGRYTELFFLDEATGLAAGHRPCFECQRQRFRAYCAAWAAAHADRHPPTADVIDDRLHAERIGANREKVRFETGLDGLPDGVFVTLAGNEKTPYLLWNGELHAWTPAGYRDRRPRPVGARVSVLTPKSTVAVIRAGYTPDVHSSARPTS